MVAPSRAGVHVLAGLIDAERLMTRLMSSEARSFKRATAAAVLMVPQVPWEWTLGRACVAPPIREPIS